LLKIAYYVNKFILLQFTTINTTFTLSFQFQDIKKFNDNFYVFIFFEYFTVCDFLSISIVQLLI